MPVPTALALLIRELGEKMQLQGLAFNHEGACAVKLDHRFAINFQYRENQDLGQDQLWFYADLGVPAGGEQIYGQLLRGNLFWDATKGATLSLSGDTPAHILMTMALDWRGLNDTLIALRLETFVNCVEDWTEFIANSSAQAAVNQAISQAASQNAQG